MEKQSFDFRLTIISEDLVLIDVEQGQGLLFLLTKELDTKLKD